MHIRHSANPPLRFPTPHKGNPEQARFHFPEKRTRFLFFSYIAPHMNIGAYCILSASFRFAIAFLRHAPSDAPSTLRIFDVSSGGASERLFSIGKNLIILLSKNPFFIKLVKILLSLSQKSRVLFPGLHLPQNVAEIFFLRVRKIRKTRDIGLGKCNRNFDCGLFSYCRAFSTKKAFLHIAVRFRRFFAVFALASGFSTPR